MGSPMFSIIVVALNAGDKLLQTIESVRIQSCLDFEVIVKDGGSTDHSISELKELRRKGMEEEPAFWNRIRIIEEPDKSIYEGMNQATKYAQGQYLYFLNCGDYLYRENVLEELKLAMEKASGAQGMKPGIFYGDIYDALRDNRIASNPRIDGFACYRNVPCHQACFYHNSLFAERGYKPQYRVRADYEHFLWCFYEKKADIKYVPLILASYEGGGFSETRQNRRKSKKEHKEITSLYMSKGELLKYRTILALTLAPLRTGMANSPVLSGFYNRCKDLLYHRGQ